VKTLKAFLLIILSLTIRLAYADEDTIQCDSLEYCLSKLVEIAQPPDVKIYGMRQDISNFAAQFPKFKEEAISPLIELAQHKNENVADIADYALSSYKNIDVKYLESILDILDSRKDAGWLGSILGRIDSEKAAEEAVKRYLVSESAPGNQEAFGVKLSGIRALPSIINAIKCEYGCNDDTYYLIGSVLREMEEEKVKAAQSILIVARDKTLSNKIRNGALYSISYLGKSANIIENQLLETLKDSPQLEDSIYNTLIGIKSSHSAQFFVQQLAEGANEHILRELAELGSNGISAGYAVTTILDNEEDELHVFAARTLGYIGYKEAASKLVQLLEVCNDIQICLVLSESLGMLKANIALPVLEETSKKHWYPGVRKAALDAIEQIKSNKVNASSQHKNNIGYDYFDFQHMHVETCNQITLKNVLESPNRKLYPENAKEKLKELSYKSVILSYGANDEEQQKSENPDAIIEVNQDNIIEHRNEIEQIPQVALKVDDGWLLGSNRGEWGGELVHISNKGAQNTLLNENIEDIYKLGERYIATTGLAHLSMNNGTIFELYKNSEGVWFSKKWLTLPGAPMTSWFVETSELLINTYNGGSILLSESGAFRMATCK
jgi:HEAT repeat protein